MKVKSIFLCAATFVLLCLGIAPLSSASDVTSSEFSSQVAADSYANSGDMNATISIENQYANYESKGEKLAFATSLGCSTSCSTGCTTTCTGCCSHKCSGRCK